MLCLSRKLHETIVLTTPEGRRIKVSIADIDHNKVRLAFEADKEVKIYREELRR